MARLNVPVQTPLRFHSHVPGSALPLGELGKPETVTIEYEGRRLVWHELGRSDGELEPAYDYAPTVTVVVDDGDDESTLYGLTLRFLSAIAFHYQVGTSIYGPAGDGEIDPLHPACSRQRYALRRTSGIMAVMRSRT